MTCPPPGSDAVLVSAGNMRVALLLLIAAFIGLVCYTIDIGITRDPGPPPRGKP